MDFKLYADESGTSSVDKCYTIGCLLLPVDYENKFRELVTELKTKHGLKDDRELKWSKLKNNYGLVNFMIDVTKLIMSTECRFISKVTWKKYYRKWQSNREEAFYTSYTLLIEFCAKILNSNISAKIDDRNDKYNKQHEVVEIIANHKLKNLNARIKSVEKENSKSELFIQIADLFTGAINSSHNLFIDKNIQIHKGKLIAIQKISECLSWDNLYYDTYPNNDINIWHFPEKEYRNKPKTREIIKNYNVEYVGKDDIGES